MTHPSHETIDPIVRAALAEDVGDGDVTTLLTVPAETQQSGRLIAKQAGVIAGIEVARGVWTMLDPTTRLVELAEDGSRVEPGDTIATVHGPGRALLMGERTALNFLQRMSGIATLTRQFVEAVKGTRATILDTRKTAPGLRVLDKWAVRLGGGHNHRIGLFDMVLIKNNHISAAGGISEAVRRVRAGDLRKRKIEVEVKTLAELEETLQLNVDQILLDNMSLATLGQAVTQAAGRVPLEASGNVTLETVASVAATGVDFISVGALTHSVRALDLSLRLFEPTP